MLFVCIVSSLVGVEVGMLGSRCWQNLGNLVLLLNKNIYNTPTRTMELFWCLCVHFVFLVGEVCRYVWIVLIYMGIRRK